MNQPPVIPAPPWPHCGQGADPSSDPVGCRGIHVPGHTACLAHLPEADRDAYLEGLSPGADIDHRSTPFTQPLLTTLLDALRDPTTGKPHLGDASFGGAQFPSDASFGGAQFSGVARFAGAKFGGNTWFDGAEFSGSTWFTGAQFSGSTRFDEAEFSGSTWFTGAQFSGSTRFDEAQFSGSTWFDGARFSGDASFGGARFSGDSCFDGAHFSGNAGFIRTQFSSESQPAEARFVRTQFSGEARFSWAKFSGDAAFGWAQFSGVARFAEAQFSGNASFDGAQFFGNAGFALARFSVAPALGPLECAGAMRLQGAVFEAPVTLEIAAREVRCTRTRWAATAMVRLRYAQIDLGHAVLSAPLAITAHPAPFTTTWGSAMGESLLSDCPDGVRVSSVQGVDTAHLLLTDTDLSDCLFSGAFHLDQLRLEGRTLFSPTPTGWHRRGMRLTRWTRRRSLAEEHHWRAQTADQPAPPPGHTTSLRQWRTGPHHPDPGLTPGPEDVAALYRQLRKAFEDSKNAPGAADFYYGECEMRRHDHTSTPTSERRLLWAYWLLSGYGLRASRAFTWLLTAMALTVLLLTGFGLPNHEPDPTTTGALHGSKIALSTSTPHPTLHGDFHKRMATARVEKATRIAINSVVFRSSGQNLTTAGTYIEMTSRLLEPTLLALGVLAIRGRIKR